MDKPPHLRKKIMMTLKKHYSSFVRKYNEYLEAIAPFMEKFLFVYLERALRYAFVFLGAILGLRLIFLGDPFLIIMGIAIFCVVLFMLNAKDDDDDE